MTTRLPPAARLTDKYTVNAETGCWEWTAALSGDGYGLIWNSETTKHDLAHRVSYEAVNGPLGDLCALHECDNRKCINPAHLFPGTRYDNGKDAEAKGRHRQGEAHAFAKLTTDDVLHIRSMYALGKSSMSALAAKFGIGVPSVSNIINRKTWKSI